MAARLKAADEAAIVAGWQAERFAREKMLKPLKKYLEPAPVRGGPGGNARVIDMFRRFAAKQAKTETEGPTDGNG